MMPTALITGGGIRIGRSIAAALAMEGYDLHIHVHRSLSEAQELERTLRDKGHLTDNQVFEIHQSDLSDPEGQDALVRSVKSKVGKLDLLVHNAAYFQRSRFQDVTREAFKKIMAINLDAPYFVTQNLLPLLERSDAPHVVFIGDILGERPDLEMSHYSISKAGIGMLTRALAIELAPQIRVNAIAPGPVSFPEDYSVPDKELVLSRTPLGREGHPDDIANSVLLLSRIPYMTGHILHVDGGRSALQ